jgi:hypothetical protein
MEVLILQIEELHLFGSRIKRFAHKANKIIGNAAAA